MTMRDDEQSMERFTRVCDGFEQAWRGVPSARRESQYVFAGAPVRLRIVGERLARHLEAPIAHLRRPLVSRQPHLAIDLWDERESDVPRPADAVRHAAGKTWTYGDGVFAASPDGRLVSHQLRRSVIWFDRHTQRMAGWFADGADLSLHQRGKPLQMLLALWASDRGLQAVHAALVARNGCGVLVPGRSGSGKSTVALACLAAGFTYLGDDWIGVGGAADGSFRGHGLYSSTSLEPSHAACFPLLRAHAIAPQDGREQKSLVLLANLYPGQLAESAVIQALALPCIVDRRGAGWWPASKRDALLRLAPSSVFAMRPRGGREGVERLAQLADGLPAYRLEIGTDLDDIPRRMDEIVAEVASPGRRRISTQSEKRFSRE